jgi:hypothetical protein
VAKLAGGGRFATTMTDESSSSTGDPRRPLLRVAVIGNYLPRQCSIATFTTDLCEALAGAGGDGAECPAWST